MTIPETHYTSLSASSENHKPEQPASLPQRYADWISYAVAVVQQAAPTVFELTQTQA